MPKSPLHGRRVHIAGSIVSDLAVASTAEVNSARAFVSALVIDLMKAGACFVVPVDADKKREGDDQAICFDWLVWETLTKNLAKRPASAPNPLAIAVQHHKSESQIPEDKIELWDGIRASDVVSIDNASHWNMNSKRMEIQAQHGDILITLGGTEGVLYLANLYHQAGKPVIPLNYALCQGTTGSLKLFNEGLIKSQSSKFFRVTGNVAAHAWMNRLNFTTRHDVPHRVEEVIRLLESLERPIVFAVRLLNPKHPDFVNVDNFFQSVAKYVVEDELGYQLCVVDGKQSYEHPRIDAEIFSKLHHSSVVIADITGERPNCFIELGYALGRSIPTILTAKAGVESPFDIKTLPCHPWNPEGLHADERRIFREFWGANINRPPLVAPDPIVP